MSSPIGQVRFGILGAARIAPAALCHPARTVKEAAVVAVASRDPARAHAFAKRFNIPKVHQTYQDLISDPELDAVYIPLPNSLHAEWAIRAMKAGKHVLCEKPLASNADEAREMARVAAQTGRILVEAFHYRYHPLATRLKAIVDSGELGSIQHLEAHFCVPLILPGDIRYQYELAGGATMDLGCYTVNLLRYLTGMEPKVSAAYARLSSPQVDRYMRAELEFANGCSGRIVCSLFSIILLRSSAVVRGTKGELRVLGVFHPHLFNRIRVKCGQNVSVERVPGDTTFTYQLRAFVDALKGRGPIITTAEDAIANMHIIDEIYRRAGLKRRGT